MNKIMEDRIVEFRKALSKLDESINLLMEIIQSNEFEMSDREEDFSYLLEDIQNEITSIQEERGWI